MAPGAQATISIPLPAALNKLMREELAKWLVAQAENIRKGTSPITPDLVLSWYWVKPEPIQ